MGHSVHVYCFVERVVAPLKWCWERAIVWRVVLRHQSVCCALYVRLYVCVHTAVFSIYTKTSRCTSKCEKTETKIQFKFEYHSWQFYFASTFYRSRGVLSKKKEIFFLKKQRKEKEEFKKADFIVSAYESSIFKTSGNNFENSVSAFVDLFSVKLKGKYFFGISIHPKE